jgi:hypothetical protein
MCFSKPNIPAPPPPPQDIKQPDVANFRRRQQKPQAATVLTGPAGVAAGDLNTGGNTLLGA